MSIQKDQVNSSTQKLCIECNSFFGSEAFKGRCSSCYKQGLVYFRKFQKEQQSDRKGSIETSADTCFQATIAKVQFIKKTTQQQQKSQQKPEEIQKDKKRCFSCKKKVGLLGIQCKCGFVYCNGHRLPQEHDCQFNHKQQAKKRLQSQLVKCENQKIDQI